MMWCSGDSKDPLSITPCVLQTVGTLLVMPVTFFVVITQFHRAARLIKSLGRRPEKPPGIRFATATIVVLLVSIHVGWICVLPVLRQHSSPYEWFFSIGMLVSWVLLLGLLCAGYVLWTPVRVRGAAMAGLIAYMSCALGFLPGSWMDFGGVEDIEWMELGLMFTGALLTTGIVVIEHNRYGLKQCGYLAQTVSIHWNWEDCCVQVSDLVKKT